MSPLRTSELVAVVTFALLLGPFYILRLRWWAQDRRESAAHGETHTSRHLKAA